ncbi:hypothetical protein RV134_350439 [Roseovarius sp. EC-HK134]|nr:hypothetical protein RV420_410007 [Roseovarius sp. EC-SD190]VVT30019.1 hypothetical protein RV134_350439 [Roseovarius sp. EC-HK134]
MSSRPRPVRTVPRNSWWPQGFAAERSVGFPVFGGDGAAGGLNKEVQVGGIGFRLADVSVRDRMCHAALPDQFEQKRMAGAVELGALIGIGHE